MSTSKSTVEKVEDNAPLWITRENQKIRKGGGNLSMYNNNN